jgi:uncharacterized coiled-coil protein SlyX
MFNSTVDFYISVGAQAIQGGNKELALNTNFNPENAEYRKSVFPRYSAFMREVFSAENAGSMTKNDRIIIFSEVKDKAISKIVSARNVALVNQTEVTITEVNSEVVKLQAEVAKLQSELKVVNNTNTQLQAKVSRLESAIAKVRTVNLNGVITKVAVFTGIKQSV